MSAAAAFQQRCEIRSDREWFREALTKRDGYRCVNCGAEEGLHIDHCVPVVIGGSNDLENLQFLCQPCNYAKRTKIFNARFASLCAVEPALLCLERECESFIPKPGHSYEWFSICYMRPRLTKLVGHGRPTPEMDAYHAKYPSREAGPFLVLDFSGIYELPDLPDEFIFTSEAWDICCFHLLEILGGR